MAGGPRRGLWTTAGASRGATPVGPVGQYGPTMRRGLVHVLAWLLATGAAVTLSWWGVSTVMEGTAYDPPRALPVAAAGAEDGKSSRAVSSSTRRPSASPSKDTGEDARPSREPSAAPASRRPEPEPSPTTAPPRSPAPPPATASGEVKGYDTEGGRAVFDLGRTSASLVSATPAAGWSMQVWKTETWIRVEFASGADRVSVFCTWHDGPPRVEIGTY
ncbi:Secreted protein OS=Streptomyces pilosus OX=28893 GN=GCM10010280_10040 PE=4 SV=1 [Streptomyces pilosus]